MNSPFKIPLKYQRILKSVFSFAKAKKVKLYLVGGILRDVLLGREKENLDFDFSLKKGAISFGKGLAREIKAGFVVLDKEHGACRLVKKVKELNLTLDFTDFRGRTLEEDLLYRDFTINAMALDKNLLIDPYGGKKDLEQKLIKIVNKDSFSKDPLRILRAFSLASILGFKIESKTLEMTKSERDRLKTVSGERIRDELFKILDNPDTFDFLVMLDKLNILKIIFPEIEKMRDLDQGPYHHLDVFGHSLETLRQLERLIEELKKNKEVQAYLNEIISGERKRRALVKLASFLHDIGKPDSLRYEEGKTKFCGHERIGKEISKNIAIRLKLSNDEIDALEKMILWHLRPGYMSDIEVLSPRAIFRYFRDTGSEAVSTFLISLSDQRATKGPLTSEESRLHHQNLVFNLIKEYFKRMKEKRHPRLISGYDLMERFKLEPSPLIGKILGEIEELQAIRKIKSKKKALEVAKDILKRYRS
jgi:putative nucleotidyltransferase with HDIG domain